MHFLASLESFLFYFFPFRFDTFYSKYISTVLSVKATDSTILNQFALLGFIFAYELLHALYLFFANLSPIRSSADCQLH